MVIFISFTLLQTSPNRYHHAVYTKETGKLTVEQAPSTKKSPIEHFE